jgi:hypothetical protein
MMATGIAAFLALAGCIESIEEASENTDAGFGRNSSGDSVTGNITRRDNGRMVFSVRDTDATCTSVFQFAGDRQRGTLNCTDGSSGTAVLRMNSNGTTRSVAYFRGLEGSGVVNF